MEANRAADYGFVNRLIIFTLLNETIFLQYVTRHQGGLNLRKNFKGFLI